MAGDRCLQGKKWTKSNPSEIAHTKKDTSSWHSFGKPLLNNTSARIGYPKKTPKSLAQFCFLLSLQAGYLQTTYFILGGLGTRKRQESQTPLQFRFAIQDLGEGRERHLLHILSVWQSNPAENWQIHSFKYSTVFTKKIHPTAQGRSAWLRHMRGVTLHTHKRLTPPTQAVTPANS